MANTLKQKPVPGPRSNGDNIGTYTWGGYKERRSELAKKYPAIYQSALDECINWWNNATAIRTENKWNAKLHKYEPVDVELTRWDDWNYDEQVSAVVDVAERMMKEQGIV